jgi:hypothetical protein
MGAKRESTKLELSAWLRFGPKFRAFRNENGHPRVAAARRSAPLKRAAPQGD